MSRPNANVENLRLTLRAVFYKEGGIWFAHCLEMDVLGHGRDKKSALAMMNNAIITQVEMSVKHNNLANIFQPADARYFQMYALGKDDLRGEVAFVHPKRDDKLMDGVEIEEVETKEYSGQLVMC